MIDLPIDWNSVLDHLVVGGLITFGFFSLLALGAWIESLFKGRK